MEIRPGKGEEKQIRKEKSLEAFSLDLLAFIMSFQDPRFLLGEASRVSKRLLQSLSKSIAWNDSTGNLFYDATGGLFYFNTDLLSRFCSSYPKAQITSLSLHELDDKTLSKIKHLKLKHLQLFYPLISLEMDQWFQGLELHSLLLWKEIRSHSLPSLPSLVRGCHRMSELRTVSMSLESVRLLSHLPLTELNLLEEGKDKGEEEEEREEDEEDEKKESSLTVVNKFPLKKLSVRFPLGERYKHLLDLDLVELEVKDNPRHLKPLKKHSVKELSVGACTSKSDVVIFKSFQALTSLSCHFQTPPRKCLEGLPLLTSLSVKITSESQLMDLGSLPRLTTLSVCASPFFEQEIKISAQVWPALKVYSDLQHLTIQIPIADWKSISVLSSLISLSCLFPPKELESLARLPRLRHLVLHAQGLLLRKFRALISMTALRTLELVDAPFPLLSLDFLPSFIEVFESSANAKP